MACGATTTRRIASSVISRWLQWLIGRSLCDGFSEVIATDAQICSGLNLAGAPKRGASASRSGTDCSSPAYRHLVAPSGELREPRTGPFKFIEISHSVPTGNGSGVMLFAPRPLIW